jgi:aminoglycoside phosphotransferase (APT) family kinase protein
MSKFAKSLAEFLAALQAIDPSGGPLPGPHNFYRGGPLTTYDSETRLAIKTLKKVVDADVATKIWEKALETTWQGSPVWVHGDVSVENLLVQEGELSSVIDFGSLGVGDPACDLVIAWTFFQDESRDVFRKSLAFDDDTWMRARGWALWKGLITLAKHIDTNSSEESRARYAISELTIEMNG